MIDIAALEKAYNEASAGSGSPSFMVVYIPDLGSVTMRKTDDTRSEILVDGVPATEPQIAAIQAWIDARGKPTS